MHIAIITWGTNSERPISLLSAQAVKSWLETLWYTHLGRYDFPTDTSLFLQHTSNKSYDFVFLMIHGAWGEDGQIASFLDLLNIPYQCTTPEILSLTINKRHTKLLWRAHGLPVAEDICIVPIHTTKLDLQEKIQSSIWFPCVRKELDQWSSKWIHIIKDTQDLDSVREIYHSYTRPILIEAFLEGEEITVPLIDQKNGTTIVLPMIHIIPPVEWGFDYENKYNGKTQEICPSSFSVEIVHQINSIALRAYQAVWCTKYARIDAILTKTWPVLLEINTIPWFTAQSLFPKSAAVANIPFPQLLQHLLDLSGAK